MNFTELLPHSAGIVFATLYIIQSLAIVIGNLVTIVAFVTNTQQLRRRKFYFLINLAISDFLVGAVAVPWSVYDYIVKGIHLWYHSGNNFRTVIARRTLGLFLVSASLLNVTMVSLERMYATWFPLKHRFTAQKTYLQWIALTWALSTVIPSISLANSYSLLSDDIFYVIYAVHSSFLLVIICISYMCMWLKIKCAKHPPRNACDMQSYKLTVSLFIVTLVSLLTILPTLIITTQKNKFTEPRAFQWAFYCALFFFCANSLVNPLIYTLRMPVFRKTVARIVCRRSATRPSLPCEFKVKKSVRKMEGLETFDTHL